LTLFVVLHKPLSLLAILRLGLFQACLGALAVIFAGLLNRVMLSELGYPGLLVGGALAFEQFMAPSRVLFGQISDGYPLFGRRRVPYVLIGTLLFSGLAVLAVPLIFRVGRLLSAGSQPGLALGIAALCGLFAAYGLAISLATTPYLALVIDRTDEAERPRAVALVWCMLTVGIVVGAILTSLSLRSLDQVRDPAILEPVLTQFMLKVSLIVIALTLLATWNMETGSSHSGLAATSKTGNMDPGERRQEAITLRQSWGLITSSRQVLIFFAFLVAFTLGLFLQDPILESYGAQVFGLSISASTQLNAFWGVGTLVGLLLAGLLVVPRLGKLPTARLGCRLIVIALVLLILCGFSRSVPVLQAVMVLFGLAAGIATNSALCLMLDLTLPQAAGAFVGVWGLAQALSRAIGKLLGGGLLDLGRHLPFGSGPFPAFALVLSVEALVAVGALFLLASLNVHEFRQDTARSLERVLAMEMG
jgi:MFS transporter, BCD family, chlorophyll transporter